jgi:tRNA(Ile)-lysidine synthase
MIRILGKIPNTVTIACSGGIDSMAIANFLKEGKRKINLAFFNHDTIHSRDAQTFVEDYADVNNLNLHIGFIKGSKGKRSMEEFWRDERYDFFNRIKSEFLITCHHLDDVVETWVMSSMHGTSKLIPYQRSNNVFRPFLMTSKKTLLEYANKRNLKWVEDPTNSGSKYTRNYVRNIMMPHILRINPGIKTMIRKKMVETYL